MVHNVHLYHQLGVDIFVVDHVTVTTRVCPLVLLQLFHAQTYWTLWKWKQKQNNRKNSN